MKLNEEPRLPPGLTPLVQRLTDILRPMLRQLNAVTDRTDTPIAALSALAVGASPHTFTAEADGALAVAGGTVSLLEYGRNGNFTSLGLTSGLVPIKRGDALRITYSVAPSILLIPQ